VNTQRQRELNQFDAQKVQQDREELEDELAGDQPDDNDDDSDDEGAPEGERFGRWDDECDDSDVVMTRALLRGRALGGEGMMMIIMRRWWWWWMKLPSLRERDYHFRSEKLILDINESTKGVTVLRKLLQHTKALKPKALKKYYHRRMVCPYTGTTLVRGKGAVLMPHGVDPAYKGHWKAILDFSKSKLLYSINIADKGY
jgi:hypothetical protein